MRPRYAIVLVPKAMMYGFSVSPDEPVEETAWTLRGARRKLERIHASRLIAGLPELNLEIRRNENGYERV